MTSLDAGGEGSWSAELSLKKQILKDVAEGNF
jgi:hypothetical protein